MEASIHRFSLIFFSPAIDLFITSKLYLEGTNFSGVCFGVRDGLCLFVCNFSFLSKAVWIHVLKSMKHSLYYFNQF